MKRHVHGSIAVGMCLVMALLASTVVPSYAQRSGGSRGGSAMGRGGAPGGGWHGGGGNWQGGGGRSWHGGGGSWNGGWRGGGWGWRGGSWGWWGPGSSSVRLLPLHSGGIPTATRTRMRIRIPTDIRLTRRQ